MKMSLRGPRSSRARRPQEEGCGGPFDGRAQGSDETDGQALPARREEGEGADARRALRPQGWSRRHARRALQLAAGPSPNRRRAPRERIYGPEVLGPLRRVWAALDGPSGKRLAPFMSEIVAALERAGELGLEPEIRAKLLRMSAATIDRALAPDRKRLQVKGRSGTKPGSILKRQIPIRTFAQWDDRRPGFCEVDLVAHDGGSPFGEFCHTLDLTCVNTGWTEMRALRTKAQRWVREALADIAKDLPFPLLGLDSDNGSEFINVELFSWCAERGITFTRSRPYRKNDNCFVEQKNWPVVRQQVGYGRYDTPAELEVLRELYRHLRLHVNFFQPQMKLIAKTRQGAKVRKRFDIAARLTSGSWPHRTSPLQGQQALTRTYLGLNPAGLKRQIARCQDGAHRACQPQARAAKGGGLPTRPPLQEGLLLVRRSRGHLC
jgi:hypothetical protein